MHELSMLCYIIIDDTYNFHIDIRAVHNFLNNRISGFARPYDENTFHFFRMVSAVNKCLDSSLSVSAKKHQSKQPRTVKEIPASRNRIIDSSVKEKNNQGIKDGINNTCRRKIKQFCRSRIIPQNAV